MPVAETASAAAAAATGGALFKYNRENFLYDRTMRLEAELHIMEMQVNKQDMFREDIADITELTAVKMDTYTIITVIQMGFCIVALCEGRLGAGTPPWLVCMHTLTLCSAFSYFLLSVWFAMHATIAAAAYKVRLLTQVVRLPIPSWSQLEGARTYASSFEKIESRQMFRVPFMCGKQEDVADGSCCFPKFGSKRKKSSSQSLAGEPSFKGDPESDRGTADYKDMPFTDPWGLERPGADVYELDGSLRTDPRKLRHIQLVREAMQYWAASDAFARVTMSVGTQLFAIGLSYYVVGYVLIIHHGIVAAWLAAGLFAGVSWAVKRIDMSLTPREYFLSALSLLTPVLCVLVSATLWTMDRDGGLIRILIPIAFGFHALWLVDLLYLCKVVEQKNGVMLPTGFRAVLYIDVFGWIQRRAYDGITMPKSSDQISAPDRLVGTGPAVQSVKFEERRPVPLRVEDLPGANKPPEPEDISKASFSPSTFVPSAVDDKGVDQQELIQYEPGTAGRRPWVVFGFATAIFAMLWIASCVIVTMQLYGYTWMHIAPQVEQGHIKVEALLELGGHPDWLQSGRKLSVSWPHGNIQPVGLACDSASQTMLLSSRFRLYTADLSDEKQLKFQASPYCEAIEGESVQDVSLECDDSGSMRCRAAILHDKGRRVSSCDLKKSDKVLTAKANTTAKSHFTIAGSWLDGHESAGSAQVQSLVSRSRCSASKEPCMFAATNDQRVVEMQSPHDSASSSEQHALYPKRLLGTAKSLHSSVASGSMDVIHDRYLGLLQRSGRRLQVLDLQNGAAIAGTWRLPDHPEDKALIPTADAWTAMCSTGNDLYLLSRGASPQLWHFPLPESLRS